MVLFLVDVIQNEHLDDEHEQNVAEAKQQELEKGGFGFRGLGRIMGWKGRATKKYTERLLLSKEVKLQHECDVDFIILLVGRQTGGVGKKSDLWKGLLRAAERERFVRWAQMG